MAEINVRYLFCFLSSVSAIFSHPMVSTGANGPFFLIRLIVAKVFSQFFGGSDSCLTLFLLSVVSVRFCSPLSPSLCPRCARRFFPFLAVSVFFDGIVVVFLSFLLFAPSSFLSDDDDDDITIEAAPAAKILEVR